MTSRRLILAAAPASLLAGCAELPASSTVAPAAAAPRQGEIGQLTYRAVDQILASAPQLPPETPFLVATVADLHDLNTSSAFGNLVSEMMRSRLAQRGLLVSEQRLRASMRVDRRQGELMLAREAAALLQRSPRAAALFTGTYAAAGQLVYVSLKLVSATDGRILGGADFAVPRFPEAAALLRRPHPA